MRQRRTLLALLIIRRGSFCLCFAAAIIYTKCSLNQFAHEYDLDVGNTSRVETGIVDVKAVTLWKIAEALNIKPSKLFKIIENKLGNDFHFYEI